MLKALAIVPSVLNLIKQSSPNQSLQHGPLEIPMSTTATLSNVYMREFISAQFQRDTMSTRISSFIHCPALFFHSQVVLLPSREKLSQAVRMSKKCPYIK